MAANIETELSSAIPLLHLGLLQTGVERESEQLLVACQKYGFFYLDLSSDSKLCGYWEDMLDTSKQYFGQNLEAKMQDSREGFTTGYEPIGTEVGPNPGTVDGYEILKISRRECLQGHTELSTSVQTHSTLFFDFMREAHGVLMLILTRLSNKMGLDDSSSFETYHAEPGLSQTNMALLRYPEMDSLNCSHVGHNKHTDLGSLTLLLCQQWGLQILPPEAKTWEFVEPRAKHAVINVGDTLHFLSKGQLASVVHRVIPFHQEEGKDRYSIAYFLRSNDDVEVRNTDGHSWSAKDWHDVKFEIFSDPNAIENGLQILTGMREENDM
ncbi:hypothetical protein BDV96DRAFT_626406 [Lophiotrema nucula]|uniref:Fe2OG dioxygenase domain-containing protein n=1 Tax=Lophiotrema nucula TaxID=690887 RepID=A0A6A5ZRZ7_9PLEO|nr:hypothetical protein BDV96DRAFT_626406 [Lophiotrema nucula]